MAEHLSPSCGGSFVFEQTGGPDNTPDTIDSGNSPLLVTFEMPAADAYQPGLKQEPESREPADETADTSTANASEPGYVGRHRLREPASESATPRLAPRALPNARISGRHRLAEPASGPGRHRKASRPDRPPRSHHERLTRAAAKGIVTVALGFTAMVGAESFGASHQPPSAVEQTADKPVDYFTSHHLPVPPRLQQRQPATEPARPPAAAVPAPDGFVFPLQATQAMIAKGSDANGATMHWCSTDQSNCHHDYNAADIFAPPGTEVLSATAGTVEKAYDDSCDGGHDLTVPRVTVEGDDGKSYYYTHMAPGSLRVHAGQHVTPGEPLGQVGLSACAQSTPSHLHFQISSHEVLDTSDPRQQAWTINPQPELIAAFARIPADSPPAPPAAAPAVEAAPQFPPETMAIFQQYAPRFEELRPVYEKIAAEQGVPWQMLAAVHFREGGPSLSTNISTLAGEPLGSANPDHPGTVIATFEDGLRASAGYLKNMAKMVYGVDVRADGNSEIELEQIFDAYNRGAITKRNGHPADASPYAMNGHDLAHMHTSWPSGDPLQGRVDGDPLGAVTIYELLGGPLRR